MEYSLDTATTSYRHPRETKYSCTPRLFVLVKKDVFDALSDLLFTYKSARFPNCRPHLHFDIGQN